MAFYGQAKAAAKNAIIELRYIRMRTSVDNPMQRVSDFLEHTAAPALKKAGAGPTGFFASVIAPESPFILMVTSFPDLESVEAMRSAMPADGEARVESSLLRAFDGMPAVEPPPTDAKRPARVFELRMYESNNATTLARKVKMFNDGEIGIFKRLGMLPVFYGETIVGAKMPNLVYMLSFDDLASRDRLWRAFGADPEWQKLRSQPGFSDAEIVSNISNAILRPLSFSSIR
ncbi:MAG TPA: NIPSNAP family protein [Bryobacteraceae bacterium]|nr:NIPSNAP family protein [Bryobacteraceae bacterium]